jgi:DNA-binding SARP family transcriptional activator
MVAEAVVARLGSLDAAALAIVESEADRRPIRWRDPLRRVIADGDMESSLAAGFLLDRVGEQEDVKRLRLLSRTHKGFPGAASLGRGLARRLAPRVTVEDQGKVRVTVGKRLIARKEIRRKALALLCFLLSRPEMSATRDQVLEGLWPDLAPQIAVNSLNQTVFHLRRVFEPRFSEEVTPGYVRQDSGVVWLDTELITSRSMQTRAAIRAVESDPSPANVEHLSDIYRGRFALEFAYEEWAVAYRESLHAAYLETIEKAVIADTNSGAFDRAIGLARKAIEVDPDAEEIELSLLKLYRRTRAYAAAAEQYVHYAAMLRNDLGLEPAPLETL